MLINEAECFFRNGHAEAAGRRRPARRQGVLAESHTFGAGLIIVAPSGGDRARVCLLFSLCEFQSVALVASRILRTIDHLHGYSARGRFVGSKCCEVLWRLHVFVLAATRPKNERLIVLRSTVP